MKVEDHEHLKYCVSGYIQDWILRIWSNFTEETLNEKLQFLCSFLSFSQKLRWILRSTVYLLWFDFFVCPKLGKIWPKWASKLNLYCFQKYVYWIPVILDIKLDGHDCLKCRYTKNEVFHFIFCAVYWNL